MVESLDTPPSTPDLVAQIDALTTQVQENANRFLALEHENVTLRHKNYNLLEYLSTVETTPRQHIEQRFHVLVPHMQPLVTPETRGSSS